MPANKNVLIVFDFETGGLCVDTLEPVQIAGAALDPRGLHVMDTFESLMRPVDMNNLEDAALAVNGKKREDLAKAPEQGLVWREFCSWVKKFNRPGGKHGRPIPCGKNIRDFDLRIADRLCRTYGVVDKDGRQSLFHQRRMCELEDVLWLWFESSDELPSYKMDDLRPYFGISSDGAHDALVDVRQTAELYARFVRLHRALRARRLPDGTPAIRFGGAA